LNQTLGFAYDRKPIVEEVQLGIPLSSRRLTRRQAARTRAACGQEPSLLKKDLLALNYLGYNLDHYRPGSFEPVQSTPESAGSRRSQQSVYSPDPV
jgi:hypothetical protein